MNRNKKQKSLGYHIQRFSTNEEWKTARPMGIGSSEVGAIMGVNQYCSPYKYWATKLGLIEPIKENFMMEVGHAMEPWVAKKFEENTGINIIKSSEGDWLAIDDEHPFLRVSPDRTYWIPGQKHSQRNRGIAECKTSYNDYTEDDIFDKCKYWYCQLQYQLHVMRLPEGYLCFMCMDKMKDGSRWFRKIYYDKEFCENEMIPKLTEFWNKYLFPAMEFLRVHKITDPLHMSAEYREAIQEFAPPVSEGEDASFRWPTQQEGKEVSVSNDPVSDTSEEFIRQYEEYKETCASIKELETKKARFESMVKVLMGDAEKLVDPFGKTIATWKQNKCSESLDRERFKKENPDLYSQYIVTKPGSRVLRFSNK